MARYVIQGVRVGGCSVVLGENERRIDDEPEYFNHDPALLARLKKMIGLDTRYVADPQTTTSDLCLQAGKSLLSGMSLEPHAVGAVISVTQTPDYRMPGNAHVLHEKMKLSRDTPAVDLEMGCSGYVFGLWIAAMIAMTGRQRVLLFTGDTLSRAVNPKDRASAPLFGDAGSATVLEYDPEASDMFFVLHSDGSGLEQMYIPAGGYRIPRSEDTGVERPDAEGNVRCAEDFVMDGFGVFDFTMSEQPGLLEDLLTYSGKSSEEIDYFLFHQANRYIVQTIAKSAGIPLEKAPSGAFSLYGNQNSASIPGTLCGMLAGDMRGQTRQVVFQGFGTGLSWGACQLQLDNIVCLDPERYGQ